MNWKKTTSLLAMALFLVPIGAMTSTGQGLTPAGEASDLDCTVGEPGDILWDTMCALAQDIDGAARTASGGAITVEFFDSNGDGPDDFDDDGRPDAAAIHLPADLYVWDPTTIWADEFLDACYGVETGDFGPCSDYAEQGWIYLQLDFFFSPDGGANHLDYIDSDMWFDVPVSGIMTLDPRGGMVVNPEPYWFTNHYNVEAVSGTPDPAGSNVHYGLYEPDADGDFGLCAVCTEPSLHRFATQSGPDVEPEGVLSPVGPGGIALDMDLMLPGTAVENSIYDRSDDVGQNKEKTPTFLFVRLAPGGGVGGTSQWSDGEDIDYERLHIKYPFDTDSTLPEPHAYATKYSNLDDDQNTDYEEMNCRDGSGATVPTNPTNPHAHCDDYDGDGIPNDADNDPTTPLILLEILPEAAIEGDTTVTVEFECMPIDGDPDLVFSYAGDAGNVADENVGKCDASNPLIEADSNGDSRLEGTFELGSIAGERVNFQSNGNGDARTIGDAVTVSGGAYVPSSIDIGVAANGVQPGELVVEVVCRSSTAADCDDAADEGAALHTESSTGTGSTVLTLPAIAANEQIDHYMVRLTWTESSHSEGEQETTQVDFGEHDGGSSDGNDAEGFSGDITILAATDGETDRSIKMARSDTTVSILLAVSPGDTGRDITFAADVRDSGGRSSNDLQSKLLTKFPKTVFDNIEPEMTGLVVEQAPAEGLGQIDVDVALTLTDEGGVDHVKGKTQRNTGSGSLPGEDPVSGFPKIHYKAEGHDWAELSLGGVADCLTTPGANPVPSTQPQPDGTECDDAGSNHVNGEGYAGHFVIPTEGIEDENDNGITELLFYAETADSAGTYAGEEQAIPLAEGAPNTYEQPTVGVVNPVEVLTNDECKPPYTGDSDCETEVVVALPGDEGDPHDTNNDGSTTDRNNQHDIVEQFFLYVNPDEEEPDADDDLSGTQGATLHIWNNRGFVDPASKAASIRIGDVAITPDSSEILVLRQQQSQDGVDRAYGPVVCVYQDARGDAGSPIVAGSGEDIEEACNDRTLLIDELNGIGEEAGMNTFGGVATVDGVQEEGPEAKPLWVFNDADENGVPESVTLNIIDPTTCTPDNANYPVGPGPDAYVYCDYMAPQTIPLEGVPNPDPNTFCSDPEGSFPDCMVGDNAPADDDGDGVANDADECPDTAEGATVDEDGCSEAQGGTPPPPAEPCDGIEDPVLGECLPDPTSGIPDPNDLCDEGTFPECMGPDPNDLCEEGEFPACLADPEAVQGALDTIGQTIWDPVHSTILPCEEEFESGTEVSEGVYVCSSPSGGTGTTGFLEILEGLTGYDVPYDGFRINVGGIIINV